MPSREFLMACIESSYGTAKTTPVLGTERFYLRMSEMGNGFVGEMSPEQFQIMYGGGEATPAERGADFHASLGRITSILYPGPTSRLLLDWCFTKLNAGRTTPWVTTQTDGELPVGDLASMSYYHAYLNAAGNYDRKRYAGCKALEGTISFGESGDARLGRLDVGWQGIRVVGNAVDSSVDPDATEFPAPAETDYPTGPFLFSQLGTPGTFKVGTTLTKFAGLTIRFRNVMNPRSFESKFLQSCRFCGRSITFDVVLREKTTPNWRSIFQLLTSQDSEFFVNNGTNSIRFDMHARNIMTSHTRQFPQGGEYMRAMSFSTLWDPAQTTDFSFSYV